MSEGWVRVDEMKIPEQRAFASLRAVPPPPDARHGENPVRRSLRATVLVLLDIGAWAVALALAAALRYEFDLREIETTALQVLIPIAAATQILLGFMLHIYRGRYVTGSLDDAVSLGGAMGATGLAITVVNALADPTFVPRSVPLIALPMTVLLAVGARVAVRRAREHGSRPDRRSSKRVIVYGAGPEGDHLVRSMLSEPECGCLPVALLDDDPHFRRRRIAGLSVVGTRDDVAAVASRTCADLLVIASRSVDAGRIGEISAAAAEAGLDVRVSAPLIDLLQPIPAELRAARGAGVEDIATRSPTATFDNRAKRVLDVVVCSLLLILMMPLLLVISIVLKLTCGEVLYRAPRVGQNGRPFTMYKFATMVPGDAGPRVTEASDPRITKVGRWLRDTKLNELPQLVNVIKGDMSLVGPRPEDPRYAAHYSERQRRVLAVRPGITSLSFLEFGDEQVFIQRAKPVDIENYYLTELLPEKLDIELRYIRDWTMSDDLRILVRTVKELVS